MSWLARKTGGASSFIPTSIPGLLGWYDINDISTLFQDTLAATPVTASGQLIGRVNNKSIDAAPWPYMIRVNAADSYRFTYRTDIVTGKGVAIRDNSTARGLVLSSAITLAQPFTVFIVYRFGTSANQTLMSGGATTNPRFLILTNFGMQAGATFAVMETTASTTPNILCGVFSGAISEGYINGGIDLITSSIGANGLSATTVGWGVSAPGSGSIVQNSWIAEMLVYNTALSTANRQIVQNYLGTKWGVNIL